VLGISPPRKALTVVAVHQDQEAFGQGFSDSPRNAAGLEGQPRTQAPPLAVEGLGDGGLSVLIGTCLGRLKAKDGVGQVLRDEGYFQTIGILRET
jgi:hypothetical protein